MTCLQGGLVIVSARYGVLEEILTHEQSHASSSEETSTVGDSAHRADEPQPDSRGAAGLPPAVRDHSLMPTQSCLVLYPACAHFASALGCTLCLQGPGLMRGSHHHAVS